MTMVEELDIYSQVEIGSSLQPRERDPGISFQYLQLRNYEITSERSEDIEFGEHSNVEDYERSKRCLYSQ